MTQGMGKLVLIAVVSIGIVPVSAAWSDVILSDGNSTATFDPYSSAGLKSWEVDGINHIAQQWFWCRIGDEGGKFRST
jgi:hypothetical protein